MASSTGPILASGPCATLRRRSAASGADVAPAPRSTRAAQRAPRAPRRGGHTGDHVGDRPRPGHPPADEGLLGVSRPDHRRAPAQAASMRYLALFHWTELIQSSPIAVERSVYEVIGGAYRKNNVTKLELRFNPMKRNRGGEQDLDHIIAAAVRGMDRAVLEYPPGPRRPRSSASTAASPGTSTRSWPPRPSPGAAEGSSASTSQAPTPTASASPTTRHLSRVPSGRAGAHRPRRRDGWARRGARGTRGARAGPHRSRRPQRGGCERAGGAARAGDRARGVSELEPQHRSAAVRTPSCAG